MRNSFTFNSANYKLFYLSFHFVSSTQSASEDFHLRIQSKGLIYTVMYPRVSARKKFMGGTIRKHKFAKKGDLSSEHFLEGLH